MMTTSNHIHNRRNVPTVSRPMTIVSMSTDTAGLDMLTEVKIHLTNYPQSLENYDACFGDGVLRVKSSAGHWEVGSLGNPTESEQTQVNRKIYTTVITKVNGKRGRKAQKPVLVHNFLTGYRTMLQPCR